MGYIVVMSSVPLEMPAELLHAGGWDAAAASAEAVRLLALELYRADKVSMGKAAELCGIPLARFMEFSASAGIPMHYSLADLEADRATLARLGL